MVSLGDFYFLDLKKKNKQGHWLYFLNEWKSLLLMKLLLAGWVGSGDGCLLIDYLPSLSFVWFLVVYFHLGFSCLLLLLISFALWDKNIWILVYFVLLNLT